MCTMKTSKYTVSLLIGIAMIVSQVGSVLAAPTLQEGYIAGTISEVTCEEDTSTGITTFEVKVELEDGTFQTVFIDQETAESLGIIAPDTPCSESALEGAIGMQISINLEDVIPQEDEPQHPVGVALSLFFDDITNYDTIMEAHDNGTGFGVIAQALWITENYLTDGSEGEFLAILEAKETGDFSYFDSYFTSEDETPANWGQFKKAIQDGDKKNNLGAVMSDKDNKSNNGKGQDKEKSNNGKGQDKKNKD